MLKVRLLNLYVANKEVTKLMKKTSSFVYMNIIRKNFLWEKYFSSHSSLIRKLLGILHTGFNRSIFVAFCITFALEILK